jgi:hypothetical protein
VLRNPKGCEARTCFPAPLCASQPKGKKERSLLSCCEANSFAKQEQQPLPSVLRNPKGCFALGKGLLHTSVLFLLFAPKERRKANPLLCEATLFPTGTGLLRTSVLRNPLGCEAQTGGVCFATGKQPFPCSYGEGTAFSFLAKQTTINL